MKCGKIQLTARTATVRALSLAAVAAVTFHLAPSPVVANEPDAKAESKPESRPDPTPTGAINTGSVKTRFLSLGTGKSVIIDLPREAKDVLVANPKVANAVIRSASAPTSSAATSARPTWCSSMATASRSPPTTSR
jgi:pilus assembly protein CpaC